MTGFEGCLDAVRAAAGRALSDDDLDRVLSAVQARMRKRAGTVGDGAAAARQAAAELAGEARLAAMIEKRNRAINVLRRQALDARTVEGQEVRSVEAALTGVNQHGAGNARSVDATRHGLFAQLAGPMVAELRKTGLLDTLKGRDRAFDRDVARELWRLEDPAAGAPTGNTPATAVARILHGAQEAARAMQNEAGAWIGKLDHYVTRQSHDMLKVRGAGDDTAFRQWAADLLPRLDERTFDHLENPEQVTGFLRATWQALASGVHDTATGAEWLAGFKGPGNLAKKASQERVLHFKSADDWFAYNDKYGKGAVVDSMISGLDHAARNTALMRMFGTNPEAMFDAWVHDLTVRARDHGDFSQVDALKQSKNQRILDVLTGKAGMPESASVAQISQGVRNVQSLAKLGGVLLSSIPDIGVIAATLRHNGIPLLEGYAHAAWSALPGRHTEATREVADLLACGIDGMLGHIHSRFSAEDGIPGMLSKSVELMHRLNGLTWWTDSHKAGVGLILSHNLARNAELGFAELPARLRGSLERYGVGPAEWEALRSGPVKAADGRAYLTPDTVRGLGDDVIDRLLPEHGDRTGAQLDALRARKRDELETSLRSYFSDQAREAMTEPRAGDRAVATGGTKAGTAWGEAVRMLMQFKQYPVTYWRRSVMREFERGDSTDMAGIAHLIVATTLLGYASMTAKDLVKGRDPRQPKTPGEYRDLVMAAMVQGGGLGIMGDFFLGEANRFGGGFIGSMAGPVFGSLESAHQLFTAIRDGHDARAQGLQFLKNNAPFINLFYTRMALDYLVFYRLQEVMNPGYLRRYEARIKKQNAQTFWLSPSRSPYAHHP